MTEKIRILVADDHPLFREGVVHSLTGQADMAVVGQVGSGEEALEIAINLLPDVLLLDVAMPGEGGIAAAQKISAACPSVNIIMLTISEDEDDLMNALKSGARGYVLKGISTRELAEVVRKVVGGEVYVTSALAANLLLELSRPRSPDPLSELTPREHEILTLVSQGLTNREIGERLHLAEKTIKHYMTNVLQKLQVRSRVQAALLAQKQNLDRR